MRDLLQQIDLALGARLYYLALISALAVPDMCAALESPDGRTTGARYADWFDKYVGPRYLSEVDGRFCYQFLRCSLLHEGSTIHSKGPFARFLFQEPNPEMNIFHNCVIGDVLTIDVRIFCRDIIAGALQWLTANESTPTFQANFPKFIRRYPNGLAPYFLGAPIIG
jgi:hypothetical protein